MITVVGGIYRERCMRPRWDEVFGSAGRAASALARLGNQVRLSGNTDAHTRESVQVRADAEGFELGGQTISENAQFHYAHGLARPSIRRPDSQAPSISISDDVVVRFGMIEGDAVVTGRRVVYDPQNVRRPQSFRQNGSSAEHLAVVLNHYEASQLLGIQNLSPFEAAERIAELERAEVVVVKMGAKGAVVHAAGTSHIVPAFSTRRVWKIGTGDTFVASFAHAWAIKGDSPVDAARFASKATAFYCDRADFADSTSISTYNPDALTPSQRYMDGWTPTIYLAGPFFSLSQLWIVEEARNCLRDMGMRVISPYHDIGPGPAEVVVPQDIDAIRRCDLLFAIADGLDAGTVYEIGFAKALGKPVVVYAENESGEDLKMMAGSDCFISSDFVSSIYRAVWTAIVQ